MRLQDLKITSLLRLGLGGLLVMFVAVGAMFWNHSNNAFLQTKGLYEHPLAVRRALGSLEVDILVMHQGMRAAVQSADEAALAVTLQEIEISGSDAMQQVNVLFERYLGPRSDLTSLRDAMAKWSVTRDEAIRLWRAGQTAEAVARVKPGGAVATQKEVVVGHLRTVDAFAERKGDQIYQAAAAHNAATGLHLVIIVPLLLAVSLIIVWGLLRAVNTPLSDLTVTLEAFRHGNLGIRSRNTSANEFGTLAAAFNAMADAMQTQAQIDHNLAELAEITLKYEEFHSLCREVLVGLLARTGSQVGAVYLLNEEQTEFVHFESIGLAATRHAAFSASLQEGEFGVAVATRRIQHLKDIPADTRLAVATVSGDFFPREILTIPVVSEPSVTAVISLASLRPFDAASLRIVNEIWSVLTARINGVLAFERATALAARLESQNCELEAQKGELTTQANELATQNIELEMQKDQLDEANRLKSAFLSNMSHELRTPLNSVIALSGVLYRRLANVIPAEEYGYLEVIERSGKNLLALINDILDLSRIEAGRTQLSFSRFSLHDCVGEIVAMLMPQARDKNVALTNRVGDDLPALTSDPDKCLHILQNLVGNAVKFTAAGSVEISARQVGDGIQVVVRDTGIGIAAEQLPHIFDEFRQADDSTSRKYGGTGLGLAIARKYARLLGGRITVISTPGQGSAFTLWLPLEVSQSAPVGESEPSRSFAAAAADPPPPAPAGRGQRILLVEDSEPAIIQLTDILQSEGYRVDAARNGLEALALIERAPPAAMILDLMMPEIDGFQVLSTLRSSERSEPLPVLILTAKQITRDELSILKSNHVHQLIQKGDINKDGLLAAVARMVAPPPPSPRRRLRRAGKALVLVVEDDPDNLRTLQALLDERFEVITAPDGQAGLELARQYQPDLILTDIAMPVMDGIEALEALRADVALRDIPVIAVTASAMSGNRDEILARGFDHYISKPIAHEACGQPCKNIQPGGMNHENPGD